MAKWSEFIDECLDVLVDELVSIPRLLAKLRLLYEICSSLHVVFWPMLAFSQDAFIEALIKHVGPKCDLIVFHAISF